MSQHKSMEKSRVMVGWAFPEWWLLAKEYAELQFGVTDLDMEVFMDRWQAGMTVVEAVIVDAAFRGARPNRDRLIDAAPYRVSV